MKFTHMLVATGIVAAASFAFARGGGDHDKGDRGYETGGTHQTWCDVSPSCNGWDAIITQIKANHAAEMRAQIKPVPLPMPRVAKLVPIKPVKVAKVIIPVPRPAPLPTFAWLFDIH